MNSHNKTIVTESCLKMSQHHENEYNGRIVLNNYDSMIATSTRAGVFMCDSCTA